MNASTAVLLLLTSINMTATVVMAKSALNMVRRLEIEIEEAKTKTSRAAIKVQTALDEFSL